MVGIFQLAMLNNQMVRFLRTQKMYFFTIEKKLSFVDHFPGKPMAKNQRLPGFSRPLYEGPTTWD
jgi:hypothetical protein